MIFLVLNIIIIIIIQVQKLIFISKDFFFELPNLKMDSLKKQFYFFDLQKWKNVTSRKMVNKVTKRMKTHQKI
jgi:hypothetical protein